MKNHNPTSMSMFSMFGSSVSLGVRLKSVRIDDALPKVLVSALILCGLWTGMVRGSTVPPALPSEEPKHDLHDCTSVSGWLGR